jgi:hypothetical protein
VNVLKSYPRRLIDYPRDLNPDSAVEREVMSKEQTFRSEDMPFGIANGKSQIPKYVIWNLRSEISECQRGQATPGLPLAHFLTAESGRPKYQWSSTA